jgi:hypothetical protein
MSLATWFQLLKHVRKISKEGQIHSQSLGGKAGLDPKYASAWLCKLTRWGYLRRAGPSELGGKTIQYELTEYGKSVKSPKTSREFHRRVRDRKKDS